MISTINVSFPSELKKEAQMFINDGYYASFSDLVRTSVRELLGRRYQKMIDDSERDIKEGKAVALKSAKEIEEYVNSHMK